MYRVQMNRFISNILASIMSGKDFEENINPANLTKFMNADERLNGLSEQELDEKKTECMELSTLFWDKKDDLSNYDLLLEIFHKMRLCDADIELLSDIMTHGISNSQPGLIKLSPEEMEQQAKALRTMRDNMPFDATSDNKDEAADDMDWENIEMGEQDVSIPSPQEIYDYLNQHVYKQDQAKKAASMIYWEHLKGIHTNSVMLGPSGCGKTEVFRQLQSMSSDIIIVDGTSITQEGWRGSVKIRNILAQAAPAVIQDGGAIIVIDEFDKLAERKISGGENISYSLQSELLKVIEGEMIQFKDFILDTSNISFVFLGSFATMVAAKGHTSNSMGFGQDISKSEVSYTDRFTQEDLIKYGGVRREIASRISRIVQLQSMTAEDFYEILNIKSMSPISELECKFGTVIDVDDSIKRQVSKEAAESGLGVRYLKSRILGMLEEEMFMAPCMDEYEISG